MQAPSLVGRSGEIRTRDPLNPIQVRYQTALHPVASTSRGIITLNNPDVNNYFSISPGCTQISGKHGGNGTYNRKIKAIFISLCDCTVPQIGSSRLFIVIIVIIVIIIIVVIVVKKIRIEAVLIQHATVKCIRHNRKRDKQAFNI